MSQSEFDPVGLKGLRKVPRQARSRARVQAIYTTAERIVATEGVDGLSMIRLAADAGVPVGTLYGFFEDRAAVLDAIVHRYKDGYEPTLTEAIHAAAGGGWRELIDALFDKFIERSRANPAYVAIRAGHYLSADVQREDDANLDAIADLLCGALVAGEGLADTPELSGVCRVGIQAADALLQLAFRLSPEGDPVTLTQARRIEHVYLEDIVATHPRSTTSPPRTSGPAPT